MEEFKVDLNEKKLFWADNISKQLAIFVNVSLEQPAQKLLIDNNILADLDSLLTLCKSTDEVQRVVIDRILNLLSKLMKYPGAASLVAQMKHTVFKTVLYINREFGETI